MFLPRDAMPVWYGHVSDSLCPSVCVRLSQARILSKRQNNHSKQAPHGNLETSFRTPEILMNLQ